MSIEGLKEQARRHEQREEWKQALELYRRAIERLAKEEQPDIGLYNRVGDLCVRVSDLTQAVEHYEAAVDLYIEAELPNNAIAVCKKIIRNMPSRNTAYLKMGRIRAEQGFLTDARQNFLTYVERVQATGEIDEALRALMEFADLSPNDVEVRLAVARQLEQHDRKDEAIDQLMAAHVTLAAQGDTAQAETVEKKIRELDPLASVSPMGGRAFESTSLGDDDGIGGDFGEIVIGGPATEEEEEEEEEDAAEESGFGGFEIAVPDDEDEDEAAPPPPTPDEFPGFHLGEEEEAGPLPTFATEEEEEAAEPLPTFGFEDEEEEEAEPLPTFGTEEEEEAEPLPTLGFEEEEEAEPLPTFGLEEEEEEEAQPLPMLGLEGEIESEPLPTLSLDEEPVSTAVPERPSEPLTAAAFGESDRGERESEEYVQPGEEMAELDVGDLSLGESGRAAAAREEALETSAFEARVAPPEPALDDLDSLLSQGRLDEAEFILRGRVDEEPAEVSHRQRLVEVAYRRNDPHALAAAYLELAQTLERGGGELQARALYQQVLQLDPANERARAALTEEKAPPPGTPSAGVASSDDYVDLGSLIFDDDEEEKTTRFKVAYEEPTGDESKDFARMLSQFKAKVAENIGTDDVRAHHDLGTAYKEMGLIDEAIEEFQAALRASREHLPTYELLGQCFIQKGQPEAAIKSLTRALALPFEIEDELLGIYYYLGRAYESLGNTASAVEFYDRVFSLDINFMDVTERLRALR